MLRLIPIPVALWLSFVLRLLLARIPMRHDWIVYNAWQPLCLRWAF